MVLDIAQITVIDLDDDDVIYQDCITDDRDVACFHSTTNEPAIIYTTRVNKDSDTCLEWALYEFDGTSFVKQIRIGWFYFPQLENTYIFRAYAMCQSQMVFLFTNGIDSSKQVIHSVASPGKNDTLKNYIIIYHESLPIPHCRMVFNVLKILETLFIVTTHLVIVNFFSSITFMVMATLLETYIGLKHLKRPKELYIWLISIQRK
jgi:hypothetical protein